MNVSWSYIPLSEAKGFILSYNVLYKRIADEGKRETSIVSVPGNESSILIESLNPSDSYQVFVGATTSAGDGQYSNDSIIAQSKLSNVILFNMYQYSASYVHFQILILNMTLV